MYWFSEEHINSLKKGDKIVWIIMTLLFIISVITMFSSTSRLLLEPAYAGSSRLDIFLEQTLIALAGLAAIGVIYVFFNIKWLQRLSRFGFIVSLFLLLVITTPLGDLIGLHPLKINEAVRSFRFLGFQIQVYEAVKVAMIMYLAWALDALKRGDIKLIQWAQKKLPKADFLSKKWVSIWLYIFIPIVSTLALIAKGGISSSLFITGTLGIITLIGGIGIIRFKDYLAAAVIAITLIALAFTLHEVSNEKILPRLSTFKNRLSEDPKSDLEKYPPSSAEFMRAKDKLMQPEGAKLAIKEGRIIGKLPGNSTQKYSVALMYSDFVSSFLIEEYGLIGGCILLIIYYSLLARGGLIVRGCSHLFEKIAVGGLSILISLQALFHFFINADFGFLTGQTLPLVSHGTSSFLCFSVAFGIILCISRLSADELDKYKESIIQEEDRIKDGLNELDAMERNL